MPLRQFRLASFAWSFELFRFITKSAWIDKPAAMSVISELKLHLTHIQSCDISGQALEPAAAPAMPEACSRPLRPSRLSGHFAVDAGAFTAVTAC